MKFELRLTEEEYVKASYLHGRRWLLRKALPFYGVLAALIFWISSRSAGLPPGFHWWFMGFLALVLGFKWFVQFPQRTRKQFRQQPEAQKVMTCEFDDEVLSLEHANGFFKKPWGEFQKWLASDDLILVYPTDLNFFIIPRRCVGEENWEDVVSLVKEKVAP